MSLSVSSVGLVGLAVMGQNLVLNMLDKGFKVSVYNRTFARTQEMLARHGARYQDRLYGFEDIKSFVLSLQRPRKIVIMVKAGSSVDETIEAFLPYLETGDVIVDGGNSLYTDSLRRASWLETKGLHFVGCGISGGEEGARHGPSMMPGGSLHACEAVMPIFEAICAKDWKQGPCCTWIGPAASGHFVKMVHNGIEYGDMQLIAEIYDLMRRGLKAQASDCQKIFDKWQKGDLNSYLIEITAKILSFNDSDGTALIDKIRDEAGQKGTGRWTVQEALTQNVPLTLIAQAVFARQISAATALREAMKKTYPAQEKAGSDSLVSKADDLEKALFAAKMISYAQGFLLLSQASREFNWDLHLGEIARIWSGGCIIRSHFLQEIYDAYLHKEPLDLLVSGSFAVKMKPAIEALRRIVILALEHSIPVPALSSALAYVDSLRSERLPANLIQAQRDFFGAHTYQRIDSPRENYFHTDWAQTGGSVSSTSYNA
jgi:6-phosphogluconate dehydrogenase